MDRSDPVQRNRLHNWLDKIENNSQANQLSKIPPLEITKRLSVNNS